MLKARRLVNSFAADLSPILSLYFSSSTPDDSADIYGRADVSSAEVVGYDHILEALLKERISERGDTVVKTLEPAKHGEPHVAEAISEFERSRPQGGQLQIIQGAVGSGKSLFARRYKEVLQSPALARRTRWSFVDFNGSPFDLSGAERWLCKSFIEDFEKENPSLDIHSENALRGIYSRNIVRRKAIYKGLEEASPAEASLARARDLAIWQDDPEETARGLADYILGSRNEILITVMDNVDRLEPGFALSRSIGLWAMPASMRSRVSSPQILRLNACAKAWKSALRTIRCECFVVS